MLVECRKFDQNTRGSFSPHLYVGFLFLILYPVPPPSHLRPASVPPPPPPLPPCPTPPSFTHNFVTHNFVTHTSTFTLRGGRGTSRHPPSFCVAGVALAALGWLRWHAWAPLGGRWSRGDAAALCVAGVALGGIHLYFAWQAWRFTTSTCVFCVAGVALTALGWLGWRAWALLGRRW